MSDEGDDRGPIERRLIERAVFLEDHPSEWVSKTGLAVQLREAAGALGECRRAMAMGRRLFRDPGETCKCEDCRALRAIDRAIAGLERGDT